MSNIIVWAAGFMDGEGTFTIKRNRREGRLYHQPYISCNQTIKGEVAIRKLQELFGGSISIQQQKGMALKTVAWAVASRKAENCARKLLPYLILKQNQARLLLEFYKIVLKREEQYRLSKEDIEKREALFFRLRVLNVKGRLHLQRLSEKTPNGDAIVWTTDITSKNGREKPEAVSPLSKEE